MFLFKENLKYLSGVITRIYNKSLSSGVFPCRLTVAQVTCIFKSGDIKNPANYRRKHDQNLRENIEKQLNQHPCENNILTQNQYGFRKGISSEHPFHSMVKSIHNSLDEDIFFRYKKSLRFFRQKCIASKIEILLYSWY